MLCEAVLAQHGPGAGLTFKWKVAAGEDDRAAVVDSVARATAGDMPVAVGYQQGWDRATAG